MSSMFDTTENLNVNVYRQPQQQQQQQQRPPSQQLQNDPLHFAQQGIAFPNAYSIQQNTLRQQQLQQQQQQQQQQQHAQQQQQHLQHLPQGAQRIGPGPVPAGNPFVRDQRMAQAAHQQQQLDAITAGVGISGFPMGASAHSTGPGGVLGGGPAAGIRPGGMPNGMNPQGMGPTGVNGMGVANAAGIAGMGLPMNIPGGPQRQMPGGVMNGMPGGGGMPQQRNVSGGPAAAAMFANQMGIPSGFNPNLGMAGTPGLPQGMVNGTAGPPGQPQGHGAMTPQQMALHQHQQQLMHQHQQQQQQAQQSQSQLAQQIPPGQVRPPSRPTNVNPGAAFQPPNNPSPARPPSTASQHAAVPHASLIQPNSMSRMTGGSALGNLGMGTAMGVNMPHMANAGPGGAASSPAAVAAARQSPHAPMMGTPGAAQMMGGRPGGPPQQGQQQHPTPVMAHGRPPSRPQQQGGPLPPQLTGGGQPPQQQQQQSVTPFGVNPAGAPAPQSVGTMGMPPRNLPPGMQQMPPQTQQQQQQATPQQLHAAQDLLRGMGPGAPTSIPPPQQQQQQGPPQQQQQQQNQPPPGGGAPNNLIFTPSQQAQRVEHYAANPHQPQPPPPSTGNLNPAALGNQPIPGSVPFGVGGALGGPVPGMGVGVGAPGPGSSSGGTVSHGPSPAASGMNMASPGHHQQHPTPIQQPMNIMGRTQGGMPPPPPPPQTPQQHHLRQESLPPGGRGPVPMSRAESVGVVSSAGTPGASGVSGPGPVQPPTVPEMPSAGPGRQALITSAQYRMASLNHIGSGQGVIRMLEFSNAMANGEGRGLDYWEGVTADFFVPNKGSMRMTLWKDDAEAKPFEVFSPTLPRFFYSSFCSGVTSIHLTLNGVRESCPAPGEGIVDCALASFTYTFDSGYIVVLSGPLRAHILLVPNPTPTTADQATSTSPPNIHQPPGPGFTLKFSYVEFTSSKITKSVDPNKILGQRMTWNGFPAGLGMDEGSPATLGGGTPGGGMLNGLTGRTDTPLNNQDASPTLVNVNGSRTASSVGTTMSSGGIDKVVIIERATMPPDPVNGFGITEDTMRVLELAESVTQLSDLIHLSWDHQMGPIQSLHQYAEYVRNANPEEFAARENLIAQATVHAASAEPFEFPPQHQQQQFEQHHALMGMGGAMMHPSMMMAGAGGMASSPAMMHNGPGGGMRPPQQAQTPLPMDMNTPGGGPASATPRMNHLQNPTAGLMQSPGGMRPGSSGGQPAPGAPGAFTHPVPPAQNGKRKATLDSGIDGGMDGGGPSSGPPPRRQRTAAGSVSNGAGGFHDGVGASPTDVGMSTRNNTAKGRKSPITNKVPPQARNAKNRRATNAG